LLARTTRRRRHPRRDGDRIGDRKATRRRTAWASATGAPWRSFWSETFSPRRAHEREEDEDHGCEELDSAHREKLAEARRLAAEAAGAAHAAAEEANRQAQQLASEAEQRASEAEARVKATEQIRAQPRSIAKDTAREPQRENDGLESYNKPELVELAASLGIEKRTTMSKGELVDAIAKSGA
jgi:hypothetical protein